MKEEILSLCINGIELDDNREDYVEVIKDEIFQFNVGDEIEILKEIEVGLYAKDQKSYVIFDPKTYEV